MGNILEDRYKLNYNLKSKAITNITFKQGNIDTSILEVTLFNNGVVADITGEIIEFRFLKKDGTIVFQDIDSGVSILDATGGKVQCILKSNTLAVIGVVGCEIHRAKSGKKLSTSSFNFTVESSIGEGGTLSTNYISSIETTVANINTAEGLRVNAENNRVILYNDLQNKVATNYYKGVKGDTGLQGPMGLTGLTGATGPQGVPGQNGTGVGDMLKTTYDSNNNGIVDNAEKVGGKLPTEFVLASEKGVAGGVALYDAVATSLAENSKHGCEIVAIGDSNTAGNMGTQIPYTKWLSWLLGRDIINKGIGGNTTNDVITRIQTDVLDLKPRYCILMIGTNDIGGNTPLSTIQSNILFIINSFVTNDIIPIICAIIPRNPSGVYMQATIKLNRWFEKICRENGYVFVDTYSLFVNTNGTTKSEVYEDELHLLSKGYSDIANLIYSKLKFFTSDINGYTFGETQGVSNPIYATDLSSWDIYLDGASATVTRVAHPSRGYWAQINKTVAGNSGSSLVFYSNFSTEVMANRYTDISFDIETGADIKTTKIKVLAIPRNSSTELNEGVSLTYQSINTPIVSKIRIYGSVLNPVTTTNIIIKVFVYGKDDSVIRIGNWVARLRD